MAVISRTDATSLLNRQDINEICLLYTSDAADEL